MNKVKFTAALGLRVQKIRTGRKMSLYGLAKKIEKTPFSIQRLEKGKINPSLFYLFEVSEGLGMSLEELLKGLP